MKRQSTLAVLVTLTLILIAGVLQAMPPKPSRTTFQSSARQVTVGENVTLKATVAAIAPADGVPTGSVEFFDGATSLGSAQLASTDDGMQASLTLNTLAVGPHPITIKYSGDGTFAGSVSVPEFVVVLAAQ